MECGRVQRPLLEAVPPSQTEKLTCNEKSSENVKKIHACVNYDIPLLQGVPDNEVLKVHQIYLFYLRSRLSQPFNNSNFVHKVLRTMMKIMKKRCKTKECCHELFCMKFVSNNNVFRVFGTIVQQFGKHHRENIIFDDKKKTKIKILLKIFEKF